MNTLSFFGKFDVFLEFLLKDVVNELFSGNKEEVVKITDGLSEVGVVHNAFAVGEEGIESFDQEGSHIGGRKGWHGYVRVKKT